jgi:hypothetical protein
MGGDMLRFECDNCGRIKGRGEIWILGFAGESLGVTAARREVTIVDTWDDDRAVQSLAVHFCSDECRAEYMQKMFGETPETAVGKVIKMRKKERRHVQRVIPGAVVDTVVREKRRPVVKKRVRRAKSA